MAVTVKENFHTELRSADPNKALKDPPPRPETPRNGENAREKQARLLRDNSERVDVLQDNEKQLEGVNNRHSIYYNEVQKILGHWQISTNSDVEVSKGRFKILW